LSQNPIPAGAYQGTTVTATGTVSTTQSPVTATGKDAVALNPGFNADPGATFTADINPALGGSVLVQDYVAGLEYRGGVLDAIYHPEGRIVPTGGNTYRHEYYMKDHLGNIRLTFADLNGNGQVETPGEILNENHYYPFGLEMNYGWMNNATLADDAYRYSGKEMNSDFGLNWLDHGARWYDGSVGRWWSADPFTETQESWSVYHFNYDNPVNYVDFTGLYPERDIDYATCPTCPAGEEFDKHRKNSILFHYDDQTQLVSTTTGVTIYAEKEDVFDDIEKHANGLNDIILGLGLTQVKNLYNNNHNYVSKSYYEFYKANKNITTNIPGFGKISLPKPGQVRQTLKKAFSISKKARISKILTGAGWVGGGLTAAKIVSDALEDNQLKPSSAVDGLILLGAGAATILGAPAIAVAAGIAVGYGVLDYTFDIGDKLDQALPQISIPFLDDK
jgi:RHS repeat-associated protein